MSMQHMSQWTSPPQSPPELFRLTEHILVPILKGGAWKYPLTPTLTIVFPILLDWDITHRSDSSDQPLLGAEMTVDIKWYCNLPEGDGISVSKQITSVKSHDKISTKTIQWKTHCGIFWEYQSGVKRHRVGLHSFQIPVLLKKYFCSFKICLKLMFSCQS